MSKRILSLVLALVMVLGTFGTVFADTAETALDPKVQWLIDQELLKGDGSGNYDLDKAITRDVLARIVAVALQDEDSAKALQALPSGFVDMTPSHWANGYASYANAKGYMVGNAKREFMPAGTVSYSEALVVLTKIALNGDLTAAEKANALTWYAPYVAKANEIGVTEGVSITNVGAPAVKEDILKMLYNVLNSKKFGNYTVLKAIVLENDRVETLKDKEIVVEVVKEIQRADFVDASREDKDLRGEQYNFTLSDKFDVEDLLGKVADFSIDKNGKVVEIKVDDTYQYLEGKVVAIQDALKVNGKEYTVEKEERIDKTDDRLYRTYKNNEAMTYRRFAEARRFGDDDETVVDFARVTVKNGKVIFIDAFNFSDVAPIKDVEKGLVIYNDLRDGGDKKVSEPSLILGYNNGKFSRLALEDVKELDVIHLYELGKKQFAIVRTDADINGTYEKVSFDRKNEETLIIVDDKEYEALDVDSKRPVVSYNENEVRTLDIKYADTDLRDFKDEKVTVLVDVNSDLQYIGAEIASSEFMSLVSDVLSRDVRVIRTSDEEEDYSVTFGTRLYTNGDNQQSKLTAFNSGDLAYLVVDGEEISVMGRFINDALVKGEITKDKDGKQIINNNYIKVDGKEYRILDRTNVFVKTDTVLQGTTLKAVLDDLKTPTDKGLSVEILTDKEFEKSEVASHTRRTTTDKDNVAHTIVFTENPFKNAADTKIAKLIRIYSSGRDYEVRVEYADGVREDLKVIRNSDAHKAIADKKIAEDDVVALALTKTDKEVRNITSKISAKAGVFEVVSEVRYTSGAIIELKDVDKDVKEYYILRTASGFGDLYRGAKVSISLAKDRDWDIDAFIVRSKSTDVDGKHGEVEGQEPVDTTSGVVTYIDGTTGVIEVDDTTVYTVNDNTSIKYLGKTIAIGKAQSIAKIGTGLEIDLDDIVKIDGNVITIVKSVVADAAELSDAVADAGTAKAAYTTAGGLATDAVYVAVDTALAATPQVAANIRTATAALEAATKVLEDAATELSDAVADAGTAKTAYTTAGGLATDAVYVAVDTALAATPQVAANIRTATAALEAATKVLEDAAAEATEVNKYTVAADATAMKALLDAAADGTANPLNLNMSRYNGMSEPQKTLLANNMLAIKGSLTTKALVQDAINTL